MQKKKNEKDVKKVTLVEMRQTLFRTEDGRVVNLEQSSASDFDAFISKYIKRIVDVDRSSWGLMTRWRAVNFALQHGKVLDFHDPSKQVASVENQ